MQQAPKQNRSNGNQSNTTREKIKNGRKSLYLDFYPPIPHPDTGKPTRREFLGMYIFEKPRNPIDKQHNTQTLQIANSIRQKKENQLNKPEIYDEYEKEKLRIKELGEQDFVSYFKKLARKRRSSNYDNWMSALNYLEDFTGGSIQFAELNEILLDDFKEYLLSTKSKRSHKRTLSQNSAASYFNKIKAALKQAFRDSYLQVDLSSRVEGIKQKETRREFLTLEELNQLAQTPCKYPLLKTSTLFSALTGLRFSDIQKLTWGELEFVEGQGYYIKFRQQKTDGVETHPISDQAVELLGESQGPENRVFEGLKYSAYHNKNLSDWVKEAGISKKITFHCFRHTYATLQMAKGTDIFTVSKLLGHKNLKTTMIYTKVLDEAKRKAAKRIKIQINPAK